MGILWNIQFYFDSQGWSGQGGVRREIKVAGILGTMIESEVLISNRKI